MDYTEQLRAAHIASLKRQYLDAMQEAGAALAKEQKEHAEGARTAYVEKMTDLRDRPQQLRSLGLSGGVEDEDLRSILDEYRAKYEQLKERQREFVADYEREVAKQQRRMDAAIAEYNARNALADYEQSLKASSSSGSSGSRSSRSGSSKSGGSSYLRPQASGSDYSTHGAQSTVNHLENNQEGNKRPYSGGGTGGGIR